MYLIYGLLVYVCSFSSLLFWINRSLVFFSVVFVEQFHAQKYLFIYLFIVLLSSVLTVLSFLLLLTGKQLSLQRKQRTNFVQ